MIAASTGETEAGVSFARVQTGLDSNILPKKNTKSSINQSIYLEYYKKYYEDLRRSKKKKKTET